MCNNKPEARMHKYHAEITGWLKDSDEGQDYEEGGEKKKKKRVRAGKSYMS